MGRSGSARLRNSCGPSGKVYRVRLLGSFSLFGSTEKGSTVQCREESPGYLSLGGRTHLPRPVGEGEDARSTAMLNVVQVMGREGQGVWGRGVSA